MKDGNNTVSGDELRSFIERVERLNDDKQAVQDDIKVVYAEANSRGFTAKYIRAIVRLRKKSPSERDEDDSMMDLYLASVGMARDTPLFRHISGMGVDVAARERVIEALKLLAPEDGEITVKAGGGPRVRLWRDKEGVHVEEVKDTPPPAPVEKKNDSAARRPGDDAPNCTAEEAYELGRVARKSDQPVIANPFAWDDKRRRSWDEGWRAEDGGDGMGPK